MQQGDGILLARDAVLQHAVHPFQRLDLAVQGGGAPYGEPETAEHPVAELVGTAAGEGEEEEGRNGRGGAEEQAIGRHDEPGGVKDPREGGRGKEAGRRCHEGFRESPAEAVEGGEKGARSQNGSSA